MPASEAFFLIPLEKDKTPPFFYFFICILPSAGTSDTGKTLPDPRVGIWCQLKAFRIFIIFVFFLYFLFFTIFMFPSHLHHPQGSACPVKTPTYPHQLTTVTRVKPCQTHKWALVPASGSRQEGAPPIYCISCKANTHRFGRAAHCRS